MLEQIYNSVLKKLLRHGYHLCQKLFSVRAPKLRELMQLKRMLCFCRITSKEDKVFILFLEKDVTNLCDSALTLSKEQSRRSKKLPGKMMK